MRSAHAEELVRLAPPRQLSLEQALEFIRDDEAVEVTPVARAAAQGRAARRRAHEDRPRHAPPPRSAPVVLVTSASAA